MNASFYPTIAIPPINTGNKAILTGNKVILTIKLINSDTKNNYKLVTTAYE